MPAGPNPFRSLPEAVFSLYAALAATLPFDAETGLGGKLLYAGELGGKGSELLYAGNIAGAASLAASADPEAQRQAMREGVIDFLVTSLEEALRILKNEVRKRQTVAVCVAADPHTLAGQMVDRGVLPDLLAPAAWRHQGIDADPVEQLLGQGALTIVQSEDRATIGAEYVAWSVDRDFARWLPRLDLAAQESLPSDDWIRQRWLQMAPRYLGRVAQREHGVVLSGDELIRLRSTVLELLLKHSENAGGPAVVRIDGVPVG